LQDELPLPNPSPRREGQEKSISIIVTPSSMLLERDWKDEAKGKWERFK
jgi:hypothetical protein